MVSLHAFGLGVPWYPIKSLLLLVKKEKEVQLNLTCGLCSQSDGSWQSGSTEALQV